MKSSTLYESWTWISSFTRHVRKAKKEHPKFLAGGHGRGGGGSGPAFFFILPFAFYRSLFPPSPNKDKGNKYVVFLKRLLIERVLCFA